MFEFHKIGWINQAGEEVSGWWAYITTNEQLEGFLQWNGSANAYAWVDIRSNKEGHCRSNRGNALDWLLQIKMEKEGKSRLSLIDAVNYMDQITTSTAISIFQKDGEVYVNKVGGCRGTKLSKKNFKEQIFEKCQRNDYIFPGLSPKGIKISRWPEGKHFYISVAGNSVTINGRSKFNTVEAAEEAKEKYMEENNIEN